MNANRKLLTLLGILVILIALLLGLKTFNSMEETRLTEEEKAEEIQVVNLNTLKKITYTYQSGNIDLKKQKDEWRLADKPKTDLNQTYTAAIEDEIINLTSTQEIKDPDKLKYYGLRNPAYTIKVTDKDGKSSTIYIGDSVDGEYYFTLDDKSRIYVGASDLVAAIQYGKKDLKASSS